MIFHTASTYDTFKMYYRTLKGFRVVGNYMEGGEEKRSEHEILSKTPSIPRKMSEDNTSQDAESTAEEKVGTTVMYAMTRESLTAEDVSNIKTALEDAGYFLEASSDGNNVMIKREEGTTTGVDLNDVL